MNDMSLRPIILYILMMTVIAPARSQNAAGSSIVSRTVPSSDTARVLEQRVYDNGLGDVVQEVQSCPGSSLPSLTVRHDYDDYRRKTRSWLPVTSSGSDFISGNTISYHAHKGTVPLCSENIAKGIPENELGPSGLPKIHNVIKPNLKKAKDAAANNKKANTRPIKHSSDKGQKEHFHSTRYGRKLTDKDNIHYINNSSKKNPE